MGCSTCTMSSLSTLYTTERLVGRRGRGELQLVACILQVHSWVRDIISACCWLLCGVLWALNISEQLMVLCTLHLRGPALHWDCWRMMGSGLPCSEKVWSSWLARLYGTCLLWHSSTLLSPTQIWFGKHLVKVCVMIYQTWSPLVGRHNPQGCMNLKVSYILTMVSTFSSKICRSLVKPWLSLGYQYQSLIGLLVYHSWLTQFWRKRTTMMWYRKRKPSQWCEQSLIRSKLLALRR